jgi:hypothetical protein
MPTAEWPQAGDRPPAQRPAVRLSSEVSAVGQCGGFRRRQDCIPGPAGIRLSADRSTRLLIVS